MPQHAPDGWTLNDPGLPPAEYSPSYYASMDYQPPRENEQSKRPVTD
jgi:hypothetical protein